jgi:23S rRNA (cytidine1920-2'-O)/16S rRNA (cytidine1409-2'-O)-methyltransferase
MRQRLDALVAKQEGVSRTKAAALILAGRVTTGGRESPKPGQLIDPASPIEISDRAPVSRAAGKLAPVLERWAIPVTGRVALDVGASTGGFTATLLAAGAAKVYAIDVGRGQLAWELRQDARVISLEQTDIRNLTELPEQPEVATVDVSFISLRQVLPSVASHLGPDAPVIALFKPQFEVGKAAADRGQGVISDEGLIENTLTELTEWLTAAGWRLREQLPAAVTGRKGNRERLLWLNTPGSVH